MTALRKPIVEAGGLSVRGGSGEMFDAIAARYDLVNGVLSLGLHRGWRRTTVRALELADDAEVLDVATGTGDLALDLARSGARVCGLDPSRGMLAIAEQKVDDAGLRARVRLVRGDAQALPFAEDRFAAATISFGIRNVPDRARGLAELYRVIAPGGRLAVLELGEPDVGILGPVARLWVRRVVPVIGGLLAGAGPYRYLQSSIAAFPSPADFEAELSGAGFTNVRHLRLGFGACTLFLGEVER